LQTLKRLDPPLVEDILLEKTQNGLGFSISGGLFTEHIFNDNGIFITKIIKGGAADMDGRLNVGDRLLSVIIALKLITEPLTSLEVFKYYDQKAKEIYEPGLMHRILFGSF
jgi:hypothetical protein